jgi:hypothetical protein
MSYACCKLGAILFACHDIVAPCAMQEGDKLKARHGIRKDSSLQAFLRDLGFDSTDVDKAKREALRRFHPDKTRNKSLEVRPEGACKPPWPVV